MGADVDGGGLRRRSAGLRPLLLYVEDYTEAAVADALLPYVEGFSAKNIVAFSGRYRPVADMTTLAP